MGRRKVGFACLINRILTALRLSLVTETTFITGDRSMRPINSRAALTAPLALASLVKLPLTLAACGYQPALGDNRPAGGRQLQYRHGRL